MPRPAALLTAVLAALVVAGAGAAPARAASAVAPERTTTATGHDVSYPQCGRELPLRGDIAVVGVNAGTGTTTNPCLTEQLAWGDAPAADGSARLADVYVNTANPGHLGGWWPRSDLTRTGLPVANPEGACVGAEDAACAYVYGWSMGADDALRRGVPQPGERTWWLDVETMNSWSWDRAANLAVLEGMADALRSTGARVGVYSTARQWSLIVGRTAPSSALAGAQSWVAGAVTRAGAEQNCAAAPFVPGGRTVMSQWVEDGQDHDVACTTGVGGTVPRIAGEAVPGGRLLAVPGAWGPVGVRVAYRWYRDGEPIAGAANPDYSPVAADLGAEVTLRITGSRAGAPSLSLTSAPVTITPADTGGADRGASPEPATTGTPTATATATPTVSEPPAGGSSTAPAPSPSRAGDAPQDAAPSPADDGEAAPSAAPRTGDTDAPDPATRSA